MKLIMLLAALSVCQHAGIFVDGQLVRRRAPGRVQRRSATGSGAQVGYARILEQGMVNGRMQVVVPFEDTYVSSTGVRSARVRPYTCRRRARVGNQVQLINGRCMPLVKYRTTTVRPVTVITVVTIIITLPTTTTTAAPDTEEPTTEAEEETTVAER